MISPELDELFDNPPRDFSPTPLWWWSGATVDSERLRWQMEQFCAGGIFNLVIINLAPAGPIVGAPADDPAWFSETWWERFEETCAIAEQLGMRIWFYDQIGFSGANIQGDITHRHPDAAGLALRSHILEVAGGAVTVPAGETLLAVYSTGGERLDVDALPAGIDLVRIVTTIPTAFDYLSVDAVGHLLETIHHRFDARVPQYLGNVIAGSFQDELPSTNSWTSRFADEFLARKGYDLLDRMSSLWMPGTPDDAKVRGDYYSVRAELTEEALFKPLGAWHTERGLLLGSDQTNPARAGNPTQATQLYTDYFRTHRWYSAAGSDHEGDAKVHSSMAHLYGHERVWIESFHSSGWGGSLEDTYDWLLPFLRSGANLYNPHASYFGTAGGWFEWAPPSTDWRQPYWRQYPAFARAVSRIASMMSWGSYETDVALLYPTATSQALLTLDATIDHFGDGQIGGEFSDVDETQRHYLQLSGANNWFETKPGALDAAGISFDVIDDDSVQRAALSGGALRVRDLAYSTVILPSTSVLEEATARSLLALLDDGGSVIVVGRAPAFAAGIAGDDDLVRALTSDPRIQRAATPAEAVEILERTPRYATSDVPLLVRRSGAHAVALVTAAFPNASAYPLRSETWLWEDYDFDSSRYQQVRTLTVAADVKNAVMMNPATGERSSLAVNVSDGVSTIEVPLHGAPAALVAWTEGVASDPSSTEVDDRVTRTEVMIDLSDGWTGRLVPTMDNRYGDMAVPAGADVDDLQIWSVDWAEGDEAAAAVPVSVTAGQRVLVLDPVESTEAPAPLDPAAVADVLSGTRPLAGAAWRRVVYSDSRGEARQGETSLGNKGVVPEEFVRVLTPDIGRTAVIRTVVHTDRMGAADLVVAAGASKRVWFNGVELATGSGYATVARVEITQPVNILEYSLSDCVNLAVVNLSGSASTLGSFFTLVSPGGWGTRPELMGAGPAVLPDGQVSYARAFEVVEQVTSANLIIGAATGLTVSLDGEPVARQEKVEYYESSWGATPMYFSHDLSDRISAGSHSLEIIADSADPRDVVFVDLVMEVEGDVTAIVSGEGWSTASGTTAGTSSVFAGHWAELLASHVATRTHPLARSEWLNGPPVIGEAADRVAATDSTLASRQRFTIALPAGTRRVTTPLTVDAAFSVDGVTVVPRDGVIELAVPLQSPAELAVVTEPTVFARGGAAWSGPLIVTTEAAPISLASWSRIGLRSWSGGVSYTRSVDVGTVRQAVLDLGDLRGSVEISVDGESVAEAFCAPYRFDLGERTGVIEVGVTVYNTLGPFFHESTPTLWVFPSQLESGLFGPVTMTLVE